MEMRPVMWLAGFMSAVDTVPGCKSVMLSLYWRGGEKTGMLLAMPILVYILNLGCAWHKELSCELYCACQAPVKRKSGR
jgi:hypothetical protein